MKKALNQLDMKEFAPKAKSGLAMLLLNIILTCAAVAALIISGMALDAGGQSGEIPLWAVVVLVAAIVYLMVPFPILLMGLKVLRPNEALVLTLFGKYCGTLRNEGFYFVNPFCTAVAPPQAAAVPVMYTEQTKTPSQTPEQTTRVVRYSKKISLKSMTLDNQRQKINDRLGNPIIIGIVVIWHVQDTVKAVFNVDNYVEFLSVQCDSALRNIVRMYPYDSADDELENEKSLRGSSQEISAALRDEIQEKVQIAGLEILEARITHLAYAPEIAAAMLQRQQASAIVDARQLIVDGAVGMVEMALEKLSAKNVVELDEERKAAMVSNLLVVLCGNRDAQPVVNSGSLY